MKFFIMMMGNQQLAHGSNDSGFSLYRALLRQGLRVPLPDEIAKGLSPTNPIKALIRSSFRRNRNDVSPRLVVSALQNGYRFLAMLHAASQAQKHATTPTNTDTDGPVNEAAAAAAAHSEILVFLRKNQDSVLALRERRRAASASASASASEKRGPPIPLLTRVREGDEHTMPVYVPTNRPLPLSEIKGGVRFVPTMDECGGVPFLRLRKPAPPALAKWLGLKYIRRKNMFDAYMAMVEDGLSAARLEDEWERLVGELARVKATPNGGGALEKDGTTYERGVDDAMKSVMRKLNLEGNDMIARGRAMWDLVEAERELAKKEQLAERRRRSAVAVDGATEPGAGGVSPKREDEAEAEEEEEEERRKATLKKLFDEMLEATTKDMKIAQQRGLTRGRKEREEKRRREQEREREREREGREGTPSGQEGRSKRKPDKAFPGDRRSSPALVNRAKRGASKEKSSW